MRKLILVLLALAALSAGIFVQRLLYTAPEAAIDLSMDFPDPDGRVHRLEEWKGKVLIVNFWATWCPPCLEEMPEFVKIQSELGESGLQFLGVAIDDPNAVKDFLASTPINYPILMGDDGGEAWAAQLGNRMNVLPFSAVFDRTGKLAHIQPGPFRREEVVKVVSPLLHASP